MKTAKRFITACLTATMIFQALAPSAEVLAQEVDAAGDAAVQTAFAFDGAARGAKSRIAQLSADVANAVAVDDDSTGSGTAGDAGAGGAASGGTASGDAGQPSDGESGNAPSGPEDGAVSGDGQAADDVTDGDDSQDAVADEQADESADEERAAAHPTFVNVNDLKSAIETGTGGRRYGSVTVDGEKAAKIAVSDPAALVLVSNADPAIYQNAEIVLDGTFSGGGLDLTSKTGDYEFLGLGSEGVPFAGRLNLGSLKITVARTLFNGLSLSKENGTIAVIWKGTSADPIVAKKAIGNGQTLAASVTIADSGAQNPQETDPGVTGALLGDVTGDLSVEASYTFSGTRRGINIASADDNAGLLVNTLESGKLTIKGLSGISSAMGTPTVMTSAANKAAGGLIGCVGECAAVEVANALDISGFTVKATGNEGAAGGFIGRATKLALTFADGGSVTPARTVGDANTTYAGGAIGDVSFAADFVLTPGQIGFGDDAATAVELSAKKRAGGLFGRLDITNGDVTVRGGSYKSKLVGGQDSDGDRGGYGGIAGNVCSGDGSSIHALKIEKRDAVAVQIEIERTDSGKLCYVGGVVGYQDGDETTQRTAIVLDGAEVTINGVAYPYSGNGKLGGAVGMVDKNQLLDVRDFKLSSASGIGKQNGGSAGVAGSAWRGIIKFSGTTNLSDASFTDSNLSAQLVYQSYNALIFATGSGSDGGWTFKRPTTAVPIDDIYSYGEVIRLGSDKGLSKDLIKVDAATHRLDLGTKLSKTNGEYALRNADDFAKLAITWQTFGYFSLVEGIGGGSASALASSTINVSGAIDLAGTGLTGLTKDREDPGNNEGKADGGDEREGSHYFSGILKGSGSIKLAVGEPYGKRGNVAIESSDTTTGNGKIYRHQRLGLFNAISGDAQIKGGVTIDGTMHFENKAAIDAGSLAAQIKGNATIGDATFRTAIAYNSGDTGSVLNVGGIAGSVNTSGENDTVTLGSGTKSQANITSGGSKADCRVGEAFGSVGDCKATINVDGLTIGGNISAGSNAKNNLIGGLIGYINQGSVTKNVTIAGLAYKDFSMTVGKNGDKKNGSGGLLGYSWGNSIVTIQSDATAYALSTANTTLTAENNVEFGGLVYAASGHWVIGKKAIDLEGATFSAAKGESGKSYSGEGSLRFGLLICRAAKVENADCKYGANTDTYTGLYLENTSYWGDAYKVNENNGAIDTNATVFDEWVADTRGQGRTVTDNGWNAVISLHSSEEKLHMSAREKINSYQNRTVYGSEHPTNEYARYYYNLDKAWASVKDTPRVKDNKNDDSHWMETPEDVLLWSVRLYAPNGIADYITGDSNPSLYTGLVARIGKAGTSEDAKADINFTGYSYYPTDTAGQQVLINNAAITFCYSDIKAKETGANNKSNDVKSQHANMHTGLICTLAYASDNNLKVTNVSMAGTIGKLVNDGGDGGDSTSGALVCRIAGKDSIPAVGKISNIVIDGLELNGLAIDDVDNKDKKDCAPLLINKMPTAVNLTVKNLSIVDAAYKKVGKYQHAATSLFGKLGSSSGNMVTASFSDNVCVPGKVNDSIFTKATFLDSFEYAKDGTGSATYVFYRDVEGKNQPTYGKEIDALGGEYEGDQLWYYDDALHGFNDGYVSDGTVTASKTGGNFNAYLPYVATPYKKNGTTHEIKVNQRVASLETGCGTYSDPYTISSAREAYAVSNYINNGNDAADGWRVSITQDQNAECGRRSGGDKSREAVYVYNQTSGKWVKDGDSTVELENETMHRYLQSAYYSIEPKDENNNATGTLNLDGKNFKGFGNITNPFRGVIVGNLSDAKSGNSSGAEIKISNGTGDQLRGLIPYSYGSVVKDLVVTYSGDPVAIESADKDSSNATPGSFFGGIVGCIMGGDNIFDNVQVKAEGNFAVSGGGTKSHLVPIGGYVGAICGGGVIFRGMNDRDDSWRSATKDVGGLYDNPYVGRVIDGYAFSEGCQVDNGGQNYKIVELNDADAGGITTSDTHMAYSWQVGGVQHDGAATVQVNSSKGLLILSAIISSGSAAGAAHTNVETPSGTYRGSRAYEGCSFTEDALAKKSYRFGNEQFGKVRNAAYNNVGTAGSSDFQTAKNDDQKAPGNQNWQGPLDGTDKQAADGQVNSPYLVSKYANWATGCICATGITGIRLKLAQGGEYDMTEYGTAYQGLSGRYYSNACVTSKGSNERSYITPSIACIDGNGASVTVNNNFKEYADDDYKVAGVGALFNNIAFTSADYVKSAIAANDGAQARNLTFKNCDLSMSYINAEGELQVKQDTDTLQLGVGCLAGVTSNLNSQEAQGVYKNITIDDCTVTGGANAGGLIGSVGYMGLASNKESRMVTSVLNYSAAAQAPVKLVDCLYKNSEISAEANAGGFVGKLLGTTFSVDVNAENNNDAKRASGDSINLMGVNSTVRGTSVWAGNGEACTVGGLLGLTAAQVKVGEATHAENPVTLSDVTVTTDAAVGNSFANTRGLGGVIGKAENAVSIKHVSNESTKAAASESPAYLGSINSVGQTSVRYMYVGGMVGCGTQSMTFDDCSVLKVRIAACECSGGVAGLIANNKAFTANNIRVKGIQIDGAYSGGVLGQAGGTGNTVVLSNSSVADSVFKTKRCSWSNHPDGAHTYSGGIIGDTKGTIRLSNILVSENEFTDKGIDHFYQGQLFGDVAPQDINGIYASGLDVQLKSGQKQGDVPGLMHYRIPASTTDVNKKCYFAFADYNDVSTKDATAGGHYGGDGSDLYNDDAVDAAVDSASPYVTTNPVSGELKVKATSDSAEKSLFGDGVSISTAETIQGDANNPVDGRYTYTNIGGIDKNGNYRPSNAYDAKSKSKFSDLNQDAKDKKFNVLVIPGNDTETVKNYLNLVTNGGFSDAVRLNPSTKGDSSFVTAKTERFTLVDGSFVRSDEPASLQVLKNGTDDMSFRASTEWDNNQNRFTLLTVTFNDGAGHTYKVQVPIVVKRMLEIDFSATYTYGTNYMSAAYGTLQDHVLTGMGDAMTGYLTWTYNEAMGNTSERYGLDTLLESGGALKPVAKSIVFTTSDETAADGTLPSGTQLTLVDTRHNNKQYKYTVKDEDTTGTRTTIPLAKFTDGSSSYQDQWLSELMGVTAKQKNNGGWVKMNNPSAQDIADKAVAKVEGDYYRLAAEGEPAGSDRFNLSLCDDKGASKEATVSEDFFLVVRVPNGSSKNVNGCTKTSIAVPTDINAHVNHVRRFDKRQEDKHSNNESTYSIASSYTQSLIDNKKQTDSDEIVQMQRNGTDTEYKNLQIDVTDTISLGENKYGDNDALYFQLNSSLAKFENGASAGAVGYPEGARIKNLKFYAMVGDVYYTLNDSGWLPAESAEPVVSKKEFKAGGGDLSLVFSSGDAVDGGNAINLQGIRKIAQERGTTFSIRVTADVEMNESQCQAAIVASSETDSGQTSYTKPTYRSFLSTHAESLSTSSTTGDNAGGVRYYRQSGSSTIALIAAQKKQLGINVDDLTSADGAIALVGTYDMSEFGGADAMIAKAKTLTYTLTLQQRQYDGTYKDVSGIDRYITTKSDHLGAGSVSGDRKSIVFTDGKGTGSFATREGMSTFKHRFVVEVNTSVENASPKQFYANYRLVLTAKLEGDGVEDTPKNAESIPDYPNSDYVTYTLTKVKKDGIDH